jgi:hypothetical protein
VEARKSSLDCHNRFLGSGTGAGTLDRGGYGAMKLKVSSIEEIERSERCNARVSALMAGAAKLLGPFDGYSTWGSEIIVDVALDLLGDAKDELRAARETMNVVRSQTRRGAPKQKKAKNK